MLNKFFGLFIVLFAVVAAWLWFDYQKSLTETIIKESVLLEIAKGDSFNRITQRLIDHKVAINPYWFKLLAYHKKLTNKLKAGEYQLQPGLTAPELLSVLVEGKTRQYAITFPEGWSFKEIRSIIDANPQLTHTVNDLSNERIMEQLDASIMHPEGLFFPDTYYFEKNMTDLSLLQRAYDKMQAVLNKEWALRERGLPLNTPYQALILASIIEKETGAASERPAIAGVFTRRLHKGMRLQTDPTVIYGMGASYQGDIRSRDLVTPTPYNTYMINGLPPTPIAMPGQKAINAALHPKKGKSLYFVSRGDGSHVFSSTLQEHNQAVDIFQRKSR